MNIFLQHPVSRTCASGVSYYISSSCLLMASLSIIISCSILYYLQGGKYTILDDIFTVFGMVLFLVAGIVSLYYGVQLQNYQSSLAQWLDWSTWVSELTNIAGNIFPTGSNIDKGIKLK